MYIALAMIMGVLMLIIYACAKASADSEQDIGQMMTHNSLFAEEYSDGIDDFFDENQFESDYYDELNDLPDDEDLDELIKEFKEEFGDEYDFDD